MGDCFDICTFLVASVVSHTAVAEKKDSIILSEHKRSGFRPTLLSQLGP